MEFWIVIGAFILFVLLYPYLRIGVKRVILVIRIRRVCKRRKHRLVLHTTRPFWFFSGKNSPKYDFLVETPARIYSVKLFSVKKRLSYLLFEPDGRWHLRKFLAMPAMTGMMLRCPVETKPQILPDYDFYPEKGTHLKKTICPVLLIHPTCIEIHYDNKSVGCRESVYGITLYTLSRFLNLLIDESERM